MLDSEAFVFIRTHNWDGKNQEDEVGTKAGTELATLRSITHDFRFAPSPLLLSQ